jgi:hypothetical protein
VNRHTEACQHNRLNVFPDIISVLSWHPDIATVFSWHPDIISVLSWHRFGIVQVSNESKRKLHNILELV